MKLKFLIIILIFYSGFVFSQDDFKILKIDNSQYPTIRAYIQTKNENTGKNDFMISELNKNVEFNFEILPYSSLRHEKAIFFVIQNQNDSAKKINEFIIKSFEFLNQNDKINISLNYSEDSSSYNFVYLSPEFTNYFNYFKEKLKRNYEIQKPNNKKKSFCENINKLLKFIDKKNNLPENKAVIFLMKNIKILPNDKNCIKKVKSFKIPVYLMITEKTDAFTEKKLINLSAETGGIFTYISNEKISETTKRYFKDISLRESLLNKNIYLLTFSSSQDRLKNFFKITYRNQKKISHFKNESVSREKILLYRQISGGLIFLLIIFIFLFIRTAKKKKIYKNIVNNSFKIDEEKKQNTDKKYYNIIKSAVFVLKTKDLTKTISIPEIGGIIGRNPDCDINIIDATVSGIHAEIILRKGKYVIKDLDSTNGTFVNGNRIDEIELNNNDLIKIGVALLKIKF